MHGGHEALQDPVVIVDHLKHNLGDENYCIITLEKKGVKIGDMSSVTIDVFL